jgi:predicted transposase/invertase (TIGR01784 family)
MITKLVRFDWAMKRLLRDKANFIVLEGFLSVLLNENVKIQKILGSQSNKDTSDDKYNDVDILVENSIGELIIIEVQNTKEYDYFHRILFGTSKVITEYIKENKPYSDIKKVISITIAYFDLGQGEDYIYHGTNSFKGIHKGDILSLSQRQKDLYKKQQVYEIYPEYWIIKAGIFDEEKVNTKLDEWVYFLKTGEVQDSFTAPGLVEAKERLNRLKLNPEERAEYETYLQRLMKLAGYRETEMTDAIDLIHQGKQQGKEEKEIEAVIGLNRIGIERVKIAEALGITEQKVNQIIENQLDK